MAARKDYDLILVGGGLHGGLIALAVLDRCPGARIAVVERGDTLGGNHTWCFHADDLPADAQRFVAPLVVARWPRYQVRFPDMSRILEHAYSAITSERFHHVVSQRLASAPGSRAVTGVTAHWLAPDRVVLDNGDQLTGWVVDARGPATTAPPSGAGFQKFVGLEVELTTPGRFEHPLVMDATCDQHDGYRFVYVLPFGERRLLVEDTYFSDRPDLDPERLRARVREYLARHRLEIARVVREESGVLPMPWSDPGIDPSARPIRVGYRGGWFHPATGYSFPLAVRLARAFAFAAPSPPAAGLADLQRRQRPQIRFARLLNWMLFRAVQPDQRWRIFARFYRLPEATIRRFYALETTPTDRARIVVGRPPRGLRWPRPAPSP